MTQLDDDVLATIMKEHKDSGISMKAEEMDYSILQDALSLLAKKHEDYGTSFSKYSRYTITANIFNKSSRLCNLIYNNKEPNFESIDDTLLDLVCYVVLMKTALKNDL